MFCERERGKTVSVTHFSPFQKCSGIPFKATNHPISFPAYENVDYDVNVPEKQEICPVFLRNLILCGSNVNADLTRLNDA